MLAKRHHGGDGHALRRTLAMLLALVLLAGIAPVSPLETKARAAEWMRPYLERVQEWGIMGGDVTGDLHEDRPVTRAEFAVMVNRAFGYKEMKGTPFTDVPPNAWYANDIDIAYTAGYFGGTSATTASPTAQLTREQAAVLLARNLRLQGDPSGFTQFADGDSLGGWSRSLVQAAADKGIIGGYPDGTFRPKQPITRGQVACFLVRALGSLVNEPGEQIAGGVYGNLTINTTGVKLKDTVVTGDLYLTGGLGLGSVELENVTILGKIVACGTGTAEKGENSVLLRNVTAGGLDVDSVQGQLLSIRAEGLTNIDTTTVKTPAYLEDVTEDGLGLKLIHLDATPGTQLQLAGNIKEVVDMTPGSTLMVAQGVADKLTMDERAVGAVLNIDGAAMVRDLNLDVATNVSGIGSVVHADISVPGATVTMLPDTVAVRPGVTSNVSGTNMDTTLAQESSEDPRILAGYPAIRNRAATSADAVFRANKQGTIHWALTALADGSVGEKELMDPANYAGKLVKSGTLNVTASNTDLTVKLSGLIRDGSYYLSAMLVDARGRRSPVKIASFTTPDDSVPNFATGYPTVSVTSDPNDGKVQYVQARVMPTKDCKLYYALFPKGSAAPTAASFRAGSLTGSLGQGVVDVYKNTPRLISRVNSAYLQEDTEYDLYLWLNDADNGKSSAVRKLTVRTLDKTPPVIQHMDLTDSKDTSVTLTFSLDEPGTLYWAIVRYTNTETFYAAGIKDPNDRAAKIQVETGTGSLKHGSVNVARGGTDGRINITGLEPQTAYKVYYTAKDRAGNYNDGYAGLEIPKEVRTADNKGPTVKQEFSHDGTDEGKAPTPYPDTDIRLVFSEPVQFVNSNADGTPDYKKLADLYDDVLKSKNGTAQAQQSALKTWADQLRDHIKLYHAKEIVPVTDRNYDNEAGLGTDWVIDYRKATLSTDQATGEMILTFPYNADLAQSALNLSSGEDYHFTVERVADTSQPGQQGNMMQMQGMSRGVYALPTFQTIDAQMVFDLGTSSGTIDGKTVQFDTYFRLTPVTASSVSDDTKYDLLFWSNTSLSFKLYQREVGTTTWTQVKKGSSTDAEFQITSQNRKVGVSISRELLSDGDEEKASPNFPKLRTAKDMEYGVVVTSLNGSTDRGAWSGTGYTLQVTPVSGKQGPLSMVSRPPLTPSGYDEHQKTDFKVKEIGVPATYTLPTISFQDTTPPTFTDGYPTFTPGDTSVTVRLSLSRAGTYYYVIAPVGYIPTDAKPLNASGTAILDQDPVRLTAANWGTLLPDTGDPFKDQNNPNATMPTYDKIIDPREYTGEGYITGSGTNSGSFQTITLPSRDSGQQLRSNTDYVIYFVLQGQNTFSNVYALRFHTEDVVQPVLQVTVANPTASVTADRLSDIKWMMLVDGTETGVLAETIDWDPSYAVNKKFGDDDQIAEWKDLYEDYTVLQAMSTPVTINNGRTCVGSVFDLFASQTQKDAAQRYIAASSPSSGSIPQTGRESSTTGFDRNCQRDMYAESPNLEYWFIAMGNSPEGSGYAFAAASGLFYPDNTPPQVLTVSTEVASDTMLTDDPKEAENMAYSGTVTITFSTDLHYRDTTSRPVKYLKVVDKPLTSLLPADYISSGMLVTAEGIGVKHQVPATSTTNPACRTLILEFTGRRTGNQFSLDQNLSNSRGITGKSPLTLAMDLVRNSRGMYTPRYYITSGSDWGNPTIIPSGSR